MLNAASVGLTTSRLPSEHTIFHDLFLFTHPKQHLLLQPQSRALHNIDEA